jgi:hypothetical protein
VQIQDWLIAAIQNVKILLKHRPPPATRTQWLGSIQHPLYQP